ncbi:Neuroblast differentiation-associated protein AHNAK, partial [Armadillidium vulgare]
MGNVESRPINRPIIEVSHKTARPLPPLPDDEIDEYDLDSPPPYPPPPPPHEENGGKSKRISWKFKEPSFFGGLKRGSWVLQPHSESDPTYKYHDTKKGTPTFTGKNISNTIATEDNNVVTVSVIGTPDKDDVIKSHNDSTTMDGSQNSWAVRNMQLVLNSEINSSSSSKRNISDSDKVEPSLESKNYPYPDVQTYSENEMSSLPDVVTVKTRKLDTSNEGNVSVTKETVHLKRVEDIRLDYPEGKTREVSNYNTLEYKEHTSVQPLSLQVEHDVSSGRASADVKNDSKSKKGKLPSCFGKRKADDIIDEEFDDTAFSIENQRSGASSPESKTLSLSPSSEINLNVTPASSTPKKTKKTKIGSCFSKSPSKDEIDGPLSTSTPDIDSRLNLRGSGSIGGSSERVEYITPKLEVESDIDTSLRKDAKSPKKPKSNFGSCFGKDKLGKLDKSLDNEGEYQGGLQLKAEGEYQGGLELKADKSSSIPDSDINADLKTKNLKHSKKSPLTAWFGKDSKHKYEVTNASEEFEIKTDHDDVVGRVDVRTPEIELKKEGMSKNVNIDNEIEIALPTADFEIKSPEANISLEGSSLKTDLHTNINPELTAKFPEKYSQSTDFNFSPSKNIHVDLQTPEIDIKQPTLEIETPKLMLKDSDIPDNNLALNLDANLKNGEIERKSKEMNISYSPTLEFKDNNFNSNQKLEIIPPCVDLRINPDVTGEEIEFQPVDLDKSLEINLKPQPLDIKGSIDVPSANIELQKNDELKLEIPGFIAQEPKQPYDLPELNLEIDTHGKGDINSGKIEIDLATPKIEPQLSIQPKKIDKPKKPKAKFGSCFGKPKADVDMDVQSPELKAEGQVKTAPINVSSPSIEVEGFVANADDAEVKGDVELRGPKIEGKIPKESGKGKFKLGSCLGKDKSKPAKVEKREIDVDIPEGDVKGSVNVETPKIEGDVNIGKENVDVKKPKVDGKGKVGLGSCFGKSKTPKVETEVNVPETDISGPSVSGGELEADVKVKSPKLDVKGDIDSSLIKSDIDVETPEIKVDAKKKKGSLGSCFGKRKSPDADIKKPSLEVEGEIKGVPSIEGEMKVEGELPSGEIPSKKKKGNLGSCFGKKDKPKLKADIDIEPPKAKLSEDIPSVNIEANVPDVTLDPNIKAGTLDLNINNDKPEMSFDLPSVNVEGNIPEASLDVDVPSVSLKSPDIDLDFPKCEGKIEGKVPDISLSHNVDFDGESPDLDFNGDVDFSVEGPKLPSAELDLGVSGSDIKLKKIEGTVEGELPKFDPKFDIDIDTSLPKTNVEIAAPEITMKKEGSVKVPTPDIDIDISGNVPDVELEGDVKVEAPTVDVKGPKIKGKKFKSKMPSCFGKDDKTKKGDAYMPSCEGEISVKSPDVTGKVDVESPSLEGDASIRGPDLKVETKKPKGKLGSCFGKPKSPKAPKVEGKLSSSVEGDLPTLKGEIDAPKAEVKVDVEKPTKKSSSGLGSCFGKKAKVDANIETPSVDVAAPSGELSVDVDSPQFKSDIKVEEPNLKAKAEVKKPKSKFGSCFGKPKADVDMTVDSPELETDVKVKTPSLDISTPSVGVEGSVDVPSVGIDDAKLEGDVELRGPKVEGKTPKGSGKGKFKLGSCLGKDKSKSVKVDKPEAEVVIPEGGIKGSVELEAPKIEGDVKGPKVDGKRKLGLGSCFGKSKSPKLQAEVDVPEPNISGPSTSSGKLDADIKLKSPELDIKADVDSPVIKSEIDVETPEIKVDGKKKKKGSLGSCFGKRKSTDADIKKPSLEVEGEIKGVPSIEGEMKVEGELPSGEIPSKKKKLNLGSCFGKKDKPKLKADIDIQPPKADISTEIPSVNIEANVPDVTLDPNIKAGTLDLNINNDKPEMSFDLPSVNVEGNIPEASLDVDVPSVSLKSPDIDLDFPKCEGKIEGKVPDISLSHNVDFDVESPDLDFNGDVDFSVEGPKLPSAELDLGVSGSDIKLKKIEGTVEGELPKFDPKFDIDIDTSLPKTDVEIAAPEITMKKEGSVKVPTPDIDIDISGNVPDIELEGDVKVEAPTVDVKGPKIKGKKGDVKGPKVEGKRKLGLGSCFGKSKSPKLQAEVDVPEPNISGPSTSGGKLDADIKLKSPELDIKADVDSPVIKSEIDVETPEIKVDGKKKKGSLGSCFGKRKSPDADIKKPSLEVEGEIKGVPIIEGEMKVEGELPSGEIPSKKKKLNLGSCFGKKDNPKLKADIDIQPPKVEISPEIPSVNIEANVPDVTLDPSIKAGTLDLNINNDKPEMSFDLPSVNVEGNIPEASLDVDVPSVSVKYPDIDLDFPKYEGKIEGKVPDISVSHNVDLDIKSPELDFKGDVDVSVEGPKLPSAELDLGVSGSDIKLPKIEGTVEGELPKFDPKLDIDIDTSFPKVDVEVATPKVSLEKEGSIKVPTPDIEMDISGNVPDVELEGDVKVEVPAVDVKGPKIKGKKGKSKMPSCFGKGDKAKKGDAYMPSCEGEISVKSPDVTGKVDVESPSLEGDASIRGPDLKVETKKPKGKLGSCFGKPKSPKAPKVEGKLSSSVEGDLPTLKGEIDAPKAEVKVDVEKPTKKPSSGLGSCFGKKAKVDAKIETPSVDVAAPSGELSVDVDSPQLKSDVKVEEQNLKAKAEVKKPKSKFGLCFGKPKADVDMTVDSPELETDLKVKTPSLNIGTPSVGVEGSVDVPSVGIDDAKLEGDVELRGPKVEGKTPKGSGKGKFKLGSCLGKDKSKSVKVDKPEAEIVIPEGDIKGSVEVESPKIEGDIKVKKENIDVKGPSGKGKVGLGSCFGKSKTPKLKGEVNVPETNLSSPSISSGEIGADVKIKSPTLEIKDNVDPPVIKGDVNVETPEIKVDGKKKKGSLGSCFGKRKAIDIEQKKPSLEVEGEVKGVPIIEGEMKVEGELPSGEIPSKKKKLNLGSCFGKKDKPKLKADIDIEPPKAELSAEIPSINIESNVPDVTLDPKVKVGSTDLDININKPEISAGLPSVIIEENIPEISLDADVPSVSLKSPDVNLDFPKYEVGVEGKVPDISVSPNVEMDVKSPDFKEDIDFSFEGPKLPSAELDLVVSGSNKKVPKIEGTVEAELPKFDPKFDIDIDTSFPKVDAKVAAPKISLEKEDSLKVPTPDIEVDISSNVPDVELKGDVKVETPTVDVKESKIKGKKIKSKMPSCFGKNDKDNESAYIPTSEGDVKVKSLHPVDFDASLSSVECNGSPVESGTRNKKKKINFGSCLGKKSGADLKANSKLSSPEVISPVSGELDFSVNGLDSFDGNQLSISSPEKSIHSKGFPQVTVTSNVENDMQVERNGPGGDFSVEFPLASVDNEISGSVRYPDVIAVGADLSASTEKTKPCEGTSFENDFSEDILAQCSNISIDKDYGADISYRYSGDDLPPLYENVSKSSTGKDILPNKKVEFEITSNFPEKTSDIKIVTEPSHTAATASPDLKVHFLDNDDSLEHSHPAYSNIDSRVGVNIPTYENVTFTSPYSLPQKEPSEDVEISEVPKPPKRWFGIDGTTVEGTADIPNVDMKTDFVLKDNETDIPQSIPSEAKSDFQSIQFVKQMVEDDERGEGVNEGRLGKISFTSSRPEVAGQFHTKLNTSDLLAQKLEEFDNNTYDSQPVVKRTIKVKTFKIKEGSDEPEEVIEEFEAEGEELQCDAAKLLSEKLAELRSGFSDSQPEVKRTVRIKTFKTKEGSNEPEELIEEFVNESKIPLDSSAMFKTSFDEKDKRGAKYFEIKDDELKEHAGSFDTSDLLIKKLSEFDMDSSRPVVKRTVRVKTYSTKDGDDDSEEIVEEFEGNEDTSLGKSEATKYLLKKIADFDGKGISGEPFVKRTVKVKTYKTKEGSDDTETIEEFEHSSTDISLSDILHDRYPELRDTKFESHDILKSLENPNSQEALSAQSNVQIGKSGELEGSIQVTHGDAK